MSHGDDVEESGGGGGGGTARQTMVVVVSRQDERHIREGGRRVFSCADENDDHDACDDDDDDDCEGGSGDGGDGDERDGNEGDDNDGDGIDGCGTDGGGDGDGTSRDGHHLQRDAALGRGGPSLRHREGEATTGSLLLPAAGSGSCWTAMWPTKRMLARVVPLGLQEGGEALQSVEVRRRGRRPAGFVVSKGGK